MQALISTMISPTSLFIARRLKDLGFEVTAADPNPRAYGLYSNAITKRVTLPSLRTNPEAYVEKIIDELKKGNYEIFIPTLECGYLLSHYREEINRYSNMISMPFSDTMFLHNKANLHEISRRTGVPCPEETFAPENLKEAEKYCRGLGFPVVIKHRTGRNGNGQKIVDDPGENWEQYRRIVEKYKLENRLPIIQRYINGKLISTVNLAREGEIIGKVSFKSLRMVPTRGGTSCFRVTESFPQVDNFDRKLVRTLNWTGFLSLDYLLEEKTGKFYLIDCNPRPAPGISLGFHAGVDLVGAYVDMLLGRKIRRIKTQRNGVKGKLQFLDLGWFLFSFFEKGAKMSQRWNSFRDWTKREEIKYDILDFKDIKPILALYWFIFCNFPRLFSDDGGEIFLDQVLYDEEVFNPLPAKVKVI